METGVSAEGNRPRTWGMGKVGIGCLLSHRRIDAGTSHSVAPVAPAAFGRGGVAFRVAFLYRRASRTKRTHRGSRIRSAVAEDVARNRGYSFPNRAGITHQCPPPRTNQDRKGSHQSKPAKRPHS